MPAEFRPAFGILVLPLEKWVSVGPKVRSSSRVSIHRRKKFTLRKALIFDPIMVLRRLSSRS